MARDLTASSKARVETAFPLLDQLREGVCLVDRNRVVVYINKAACRLLSLAAPPSTIETLSNLWQAKAGWETLLETPTETVIVSSESILEVESLPGLWEGCPLVQLLIRPLTNEIPASEQLTALTRISREISATLLLDNTLQSVLDEAVASTRARSGQLSLFEPEGTVQTRLQRGEVVSTPALDQTAITTRESILIADLTRNAVQATSIGLQSALVTPIIFGGEVAGLIHLFSDRVNHFTQQTSIFITALANHAAIAIGNARRFTEIKERNELLQQRAQQIEQFVESSRVFHSDRPMAEIYEDMVYAIQEGVGYNAVLLSLAEREGTRWMLRRVTAAGLPLERLRVIRKTRQSWEAIQELMKPEYALGSAYLVPAHEAKLMASELTIHEVHDLFAVPSHQAQEDSTLWHDNDLFFIPLRDSRGEPLGLVSLAAPLDGRRPDLGTARVLEIFINQAANAIENVQLFHNMREYAIELQQLHNVSQQVLREPEFDEKLQLIVDGVQSSGWRTVSLTLRDQDFKVLKLVTSGLTEEEHNYLWENMLPAAEWRRRFNDPSFHRFRRGSSFLIPHNTEEVQSTAAYGIVSATPRPEEEGDWHPEDILIRPLYDQQGQFVGLIGLDDPVDGRRPNERMLQTIDLYAQLGTSVVENYRLFHAMEQRSQELQTLFQASQALAGALDEEGVLKAMAEHMLEAVNADAYTIYALRRDKAEVVVLDNRTHVPGLDTVSQGTLFDLKRLELAQQVVETGKPFTSWVNSQMLQAAEVIEGYGVAVLPLTLGNEIYGIIELVRIGEQTDFNEDQLKLLGAILNQSSTALETAHLIEELDERVALRTQALAEESERVKILLRITTELTASLDLERVLNQALHLVNDVVRAEHGVILLIDENTDRLVIKAAVGEEEVIPPEGIQSGLNRDEGLAGWVIQNREAVIVKNVQEDPRWINSQPSESSNRAALTVPLSSGNEVIGVIMLTDRRPDVFTAEQLSLVEAAAIQVANAIHNASLYDLIRQQAEKLGVMMRAARTEAAKIQSILESIADGVLVAETDGTIIMANMPTANILSMSKDQLIGRSVDELMGLYGETGDTWVDVIEQWAERSETLERQTSFKNRLEIEDKIVLVHVSPVFANDQYFGTISIFRDITKEVEVDRMKSEFVSTVSHELRTPMTSIKGYADLMLMGAAGAMSPGQHRYLDVIKKNADRLKLLVDDLLDISRIETGKTQLKLQPVDVPQLINDIVTGHVRGRIQHEGIQINIQTKVAPSLPLVNADPEKVTRILTNLVDNALNYTTGGGEVEISAQAGEKRVYISVCDTGIGISKEDQQRIFDRFYRVEDERAPDVPGTGLGLAIVSSLVEMHGGELTLDSEIGKGSTFTFSLPLVVEDSDML